MGKWKKAVAAIAALPVMVAGLALGPSTAMAEETTTPAVTPQATAAADTTNVADGSNGYLWLHFEATDYEKIYYGYSADGVTWNKLNDNQPLITSTVANKGIRDPHIIRLQQPIDGYKYVMIGTDLHAEGSAGGKDWAQQSKNLIISRSKDLVTWTDAEAVFAGWDDANRAWAPEAIYDEAKGEYMVYWSSKPNSDSTVPLGVYRSYTTDFKTFTTPERWIDESEIVVNNSKANIIDTTIAKGEDGNYYRFSTSDWNTVVDTSPTLDAEHWTRLVDRSEAVNADGTSKIAEYQKANNPAQGDQKIITTAAAGLGGIEGLTVFQKTDGSWTIMGDNQGYKARAIANLADLKKGVATTAASSNFPQRFRHGSVMALTAEEQKAVLAAYGDETATPVTPDADGSGPIAEYDFEDGKGTDTTENNNDLTLNGNAKVSEDATKGKVLTLDGASGSYAEFPKGLFDGRNKLTVQMDVKSESTGNQFTFTFGKNSTKYYFMKYNKGTLANRITTGSYGAEAKADATLDGDWHKVTVVFDGTTMTAYSDGKQIAANDDTGLNVSDLGKNLLAYLGKSFYSDPYFKGSFDNIKVWNRALSAKEVAGDDTPAEPTTGEKIAAYDFEDESDLGKDTTGNGNTMTLHNVTEYGKPGDWGSKVIQLRGNGEYAELPTGLFDGRDEFTLEFSSKSRASSGAFFSFAIGQDNNKYLFIRLRGNEAYVAITKGSYQNEQKISGSVNTQVWNKYTLTVTKNHIALYAAGADSDTWNLLGQVDTTVSISDLGTDLKAYFGKSFYGSDGTYNGGIDDVNVYNYAKSALEIQGPAAALKIKDTDQILSQNATADDSTGAVTKTVVLDYWSDAKTGAKSDKSKVKFEYEIPDGVTVADENGKTLTAADLNAKTDYSQPLKLKLTYDGKTVDYTVGVEVLNTPIRISGDEAAASGIGEKDPTGNEGWKFFADPQVVAYGGKYYIFPTTDGYSGWQGHSIHVFESSDMVNWEDRGTVVDLSKDYNDMPDNRKEKAWAPGFAIRDGKFYLYFSGGGMTNVAISDPAEGGTITSGYKIQKVKVEDSIDPAVFEDPATGKWYLTWGQGPGKYAELNDDMTGIKAGTTVTTDATKNMREGSYITSRPDPSDSSKNIYYYSYSIDDTSSPNYRVAYAWVSAKSLDEVKGTDWQYGKDILVKDDAKGILGTAHHSIVQVPGTDDWYIVYHAFLTDEMRPRGYDSTHNNAQLANGNKREVRIARMTYDADGQINVTPITYEGVLPETTPEVTVSGAAEGDDATTAIGTKLTAAFNDGWKLSTVQWYRADDAEGTNEAAIDGATAAEYTLTAADAGKIVYAKAVGENTTGVLQNAQPGTEGAQASKTFELTSTNTVSVAKEDVTVPVTSVTVTGPNVADGKVTVGPEAGTLQLEATVNPDNATDKQVAWSSSDEAVATVDENGLVSFNAVDTDAEVTITATAGGKSGTVVLTVKAQGEQPTPEPEVESIAIAGDGVKDGKLTLKEGASAQLKATIAPAEAKADVAWSTSNAAVATVDVNGKVTGVKSGTVTITATAGGKNATVEVTVVADSPAKPGASDGSLSGDNSGKKPSASKPGAGLTATGAAVLGLGGAVVLLAAAGLSLTIWRKRRA